MKNYNSDNNTISVLIIEDEIHAQKELRRLLTLCNYDIKILETIDSIEDAIDWINNNENPDLMFFDIQLSDGLSFEIFKHIKSNIPVIFTTAYDEFAIQAFKVNSIDYLLKPVKIEDLNRALEKFTSLAKNTVSDNTKLSISKIEQLLLNKPSFKSRFISKIGDQIIHIGINEIAYFKSEDNVTFIVTRNKKRYIIDLPLDHLITVVNPDVFYRLNRGTIAHLDSIKKINKYFNSRLHIELEPGTEDNILISRVKVPDFLTWIDR